MEPRELQPRNFARYAPEARALAESHLDLLRRLPSALLPLLLRQVIQYDVAFPAERRQIETQLQVLQAMEPTEFQTILQPFSSLQLPASVRDTNWVDHPQEFEERLTAWLWSEHQIDAYHQAAIRYEGHIEEKLPVPAALPARWVFVMLGRQTPQAEYPLFRKLAKYGTLFTSVDPIGGRQAIFAAAAARAKQYALPYGHWYIEGGDPLDAPSLTTVSYNRLVPAARREFELIHSFAQAQSIAGKTPVEAVSAYVENLGPAHLGLDKGSADPVLQHFEASVLTQGAGCQIFSTTFVQWAARECLRRAQPTTLVARFAPRQTMAPLEQLLARDPLTQPEDVDGSLVDADMGTYLTWINLRRLPGRDHAHFLAWWEERELAVAVSPTLPQGTISTQSANLQQLIGWM